MALGSSTSMLRKGSRNQSFRDHDRDRNLDRVIRGALRIMQNLSLECNACNTSLSH